MPPYSLRSPFRYEGSDVQITNFFFFFGEEEEQITWLFIRLKILFLNFILFENDDIRLTIMMTGAIEI